MATAAQVIIAVVGGILVGVLSLLYRRGLHFWSSFRARIFWRPFLSGDVRIIVGRVELPEDCDYNEPAGLVGTGDMHAATLIATYLGDLMVRQLGQKIEILDQYQLRGDQSSANLICLGGPDVNDVTSQLLSEIETSIRPASLVNGDRDDLGFIDTLTGDVLPRVTRFSGSKDSGLLVKAPNPWNPSRAVMIIAGSFGYGTWAGALLVRSRRLLKTKRSSFRGALECFFESHVLGDSPQVPKIILLRELPPAHQRPSCGPRWWSGKSRRPEHRHQHDQAEATTPLQVEYYTTVIKDANESADARKNAAHWLATHGHPELGIDYYTTVIKDANESAAARQNAAHWLDTHERPEGM